MTDTSILASLKSHAISKGDLRQRLPQLHPPLRLIAEDWLAESTTVDFVTLDPAGHVALVLVGTAGEDAALLTRALAHRSWVAARLGNWRQLAPEIGIATDAQVRVVLLCPSFAPETLAAAQSLAGVIEPVLCCSIESGGERRLLFESLQEPAPTREPKGAPTRPFLPHGDSQQVDIARFRSGLTAEDLGLTSEEVFEFK